MKLKAIRPEWNVGIRNNKTPSWRKRRQNHITTIIFVLFDRIF